MIHIYWFTCATYLYYNRREKEVVGEGAEPRKQRQRRVGVALHTYVGKSKCINLTQQREGMTIKQA